MNMNYGMGGMGGMGMGGGAALLPYYQQAMAQQTQISTADARLGIQNSLITAQMSYQNAIIEFQGTVAQLQMDQIAAAANVVADIGNLAMRNTMGLASKAQEMQQFMAQYREKMLGLFTSIQESRSENTWGRIKKISQGFKF